MNKAFVELEPHSFQRHHLQAVNRTHAFRHAQLLTGLCSKQCFCMKFLTKDKGSSMMLQAADCLLTVSKTDSVLLGPKWSCLHSDDNAKQY